MCKLVQCRDQRSLLSEAYSDCFSNEGTSPQILPTSRFLKSPSLLEQCEEIRAEALGNPPHAILRRERENQMCISQGSPLGMRDRQTMSPMLAWVL